MKQRIYSVIALLLFLATVIFFFNRYAFTASQNEPITVTDYKLNTYVTVTIYDSTDTALLDECIALCDKYEMIFSRTNPESELYKLNHGMLKQSADGYYTVSDELYEVISVGKKYSELSDDAFCIAMEPLTSIWNFTDGMNMVPDNAHIDTVLPFLKSEDVHLRAPNEVAFVNKGMGIDLGAIAKGYIADKMKEYLISKGVNSALIYLGGNVLCIGEKETGAFKIGIEKPFDVDGDPAAVVSISDTSVVTSGTYERYFKKDGEFYHHILDKNTGYPIENGLTAVTIISSSSTDADALSTTCFSLGLEKGMELLESLDDADGFFITDDREYHYTEGFEEKYKLDKK
ncbi:MAG: FAD:protein FMN transferase [Lachnospiraceae bacterium]|nr:FAD:protein FMN transferase [Lachnospiraceae bacterium]